MNTTSEVLVMGVSCPNLRVRLRRTIIQLYPNNLNKYYTVNVDYRTSLVELTANLRHYRSIDLCDTPVYSYFVGDASYTVTTTDAASKAFIQNDSNGQLANSKITKREVFLNFGPPIFRLFVDYLLCDFGCESESTVSVNGIISQNEESTD